jgi:hypothetical protein
MLATSAARAIELCPSAIHTQRAMPHVGQSILRCERAVQTAVSKRDNVITCLQAREAATDRGNDGSDERSDNRTPIDDDRGSQHSQFNSPILDHGSGPQHERGLTN